MAPNNPTVHSSPLSIQCKLTSFRSNAPDHHSPSQSRWTSKIYQPQPICSVLSQSRLVHLRGEDRITSTSSPHCCNYLNATQTFLATSHWSEKSSIFTPKQHFQLGIRYVVSAGTGLSFGRSVNTYEFSTFHLAQSVVITNVTQQLCLCDDGRHWS